MDWLGRICEPEEDGWIQYLRVKDGRWGRQRLA
jgi:hypothetical protein